MAATSVPMCSATSKAFSIDGESKSFQSKSHGVSSRWPLDEIGRNSDRPCTMPRTMACKIGTTSVYPLGARPAGHALDGGRSASPPTGRMAR